MRNHNTVWMILAALLWLGCGPAGSADEGVLPPLSNQANHAAARLRIPSQWVVKAINRDFQNTRPAGASVLSAVPAWLATYIKDNPRLAEFLANQQFGVHRVDGWLMLKLR